MTFINNLYQAFSSLKTNKLRSSLTTLGIVMGVFSIISIISIGNAAKAYMKSQFQKLGANIVMIQYNPKKIISTSDYMTLADVDTLRKQIPEIQNINTFNTQVGEIKYLQKSIDATVIGITSQYNSFSPVELDSGRFIINEDIKSKKNVILLDDRTAKKISNKENLTGETVKMKVNSGQVLDFKVIGVVKTENGLFSALSDSYPVTVYIPISTLNDIYGNTSGRVDRIDISLNSKDNLTHICDKIIKVLKMQHHTTDKYIYQTADDVQKTVSKILSLISMILLFIAIITLIVGGIGIVNILLVSVTERTSEIGIRRALGAKKSDILIQFLNESIIITCFGGIIGIILGIIAEYVISSKLKIPPTVDFKVIVLSFIGCIILGLIFGVYPSTKAADLDPIEAMRYE